MITGDAAYIKKINRSIIIRKIVEEEMISRADLSKATDLTRATISAQVADLLAEGLLVETQLKHCTVGRKPIMLSLNRKAGYALGIDLDYGQISFTMADLLGKPIWTSVIEMNTTDYGEVLSIIMKQVKMYKTKCKDSRYGIIGIVIGIHGLVANDETIHYVPRFNWYDKSLKADLEKQIDIPIYAENNSNLCAFAERVFMYHHTDNLLCATLYSGIGLGLMMNNELFRGHDGYAGEIGHMIVVPGGKPCNCGNKGCWEKYASESSFLKELMEDRQIENVTYEQIQQLLDDDDEDVHERMEQFIYYLSIGLNNMINIYNPDVLILDSELLRMYPDSIDKIKAMLSSSISHYRQLSISTLGKKSCGLGACALAIKYFLDVPMLELPYDTDVSKNERAFI